MIEYSAEERKAAKELIQLRENLNFTDRKNATNRLHPVANTLQCELTAARDLLSRLVYAGAVLTPNLMQEMRSFLDETTPPERRDA